MLLHGSFVSLLHYEVHYKSANTGVHLRPVWYRNQSTRTYSVVLQTKVIFNSEFKRQHRVLG